MKIAFIYAKGRLKKLDDVKSGIAASEFFYGGIELKEKAHEVDYYEVDDSPRGGSLISKASLLIADQLYAIRALPPRTYGQLIMKIKDILPKLNRYDVIVATTTGTAFAIGLWRMLNLVRPPIVAIHCTLMNYSYNRFQKKLLSALLQKMWTQLFGIAEKDGLCSEFNVPSDRVTVNQFGVDTKFWTPGSGEEGNYILSVGNDGRRDYDLFVKAAKRINCRVKILTSRIINEEIPANVEIIAGSFSSGISDEQLRELYRKARMIVVPLIESPQPSGQSVTLQAMACGKPVVLTRTRGLWSESMMRDGDNVVFIPPGDEEKLADCVTDLIINPEKRNLIGRNALETTLSTSGIKGFAERLEKSCEIAIDAAK